MAEVLPRLRRWALVTAVGLLTACASPQRVNGDFARAHGLHSALVAGDPFLHRIYFDLQGRRCRAVHVYLAGDGEPWLGRRYPSPDPTLALPVALRLAALDEGPRLFLGRPCYEGLAGEDPHCTPWHWTHGRYSEAVVTSLARVLERRLPHRPLVLIGHSGGGTLALLLARRLPQVEGVVTLAGNLDPDAWTRHHGYLPLEGSLNPARLPPLPSSVAQFHWVGADDANVPPELVRRALQPARNPGAPADAPPRLVVLPGCGHSDCWVARWPALLQTLDAELGCTADARTRATMPR